MVGNTGERGAGRGACPCPARTGPDAIRHLRFKIKVSGSGNDHCYEQQDQTETGKDGACTRTMILQWNAWFHEGKPQTLTRTLVVRFPTDLRREECTFTLEALDLL